MMQRNVFRAVAVGIVGVCMLIGCSSGEVGSGGGGGSPVAVPLDLSQSGGLGVFEVQARVPAANRGTGRFVLDGLTAGNGSLRLDPAVITVTPNGADEDPSVVQAGALLVITVRVDSIERQDTVCSEGDLYGPYHVTLNGDGVPVSVSPDSIALTESTISLVNAASFSLCIRVESPIDATVEIARLNFNLSP
ncbi:MAG: hypothetical protein JXB13_22285 [Phycisphaerae bacterium]|nr:hypothetical protein [Phycisphaerae bacterium]